MPALLGPDPTAVASQLGPVVPQAVQVAQQKLPRSDRLEVSCDCILFIYYYYFSYYFSYFFSLLLLHERVCMKERVDEC